MNIIRVCSAAPALLLGFACATTTPNSQVKPRLEFELQDLKGNTHALSTYTGQVVLLDLWATWCAPCKEALPFYAELQTRYRENGLSVIAVSVDEDRQALDDFVQDFFSGDSLPFVILHDQKATLAKQVSMDTMPTSLIIDRAGKTLHVHSGFNPMSDPAQIEGLLRKAMGL